MALELPFGIQPVNPVAVDYWSGPYSGILQQEAVNAANSGIQPGVRYVGQEATLVVSGVTEKYWYHSGVSDSDLVPFTAASASGSFFTDFVADDGTVSATQSNDSIRIVNSSKTGAKELTISAGGGGNRTYANVSADYSMDVSADVVFADSTSNPINVYIPTAVGVGGKEIMVKMSAGNNTVSINASGAETIDGVGLHVLSNRFQSLSLISDNSNWFIS